MSLKMIPIESSAVIRQVLLVGQTLIVFPTPAILATTVILISAILGISAGPFNVHLTSASHVNLVTPHNAGLEKTATLIAAGLDDNIMKIDAYKGVYFLSTDI